jgi:CarboxypepD_reg-like domain/Gram-negative bacterial TonB protein C-terminal
MNNEKLYTAADFASYHAGNMPAKDMHALEKAALEDPFLSDALDGYVHTNTAMADIESLKGKLFSKENSETKVVAIPSNKNWMRAAASIAIVFGLGYLFYNINKRDDAESSLADNKIQQEIKSTTVTADTNKMDAEADVATTQGLTTESQTNSAPSNAFIKLDTITLPLADKNFNATPSTVVSQAPASPAISKADEVAMESKAAEPLQKDALDDNDKYKEKGLDLVQNKSSQNNAMNFYNYNGVVQTATGGPMQNATIKLKNSNIVTQTDNKGRYNFTASDSITNVSIAAVGYDKKEALLNSNASQVLKLDNRNSNLDEVVVTSVGTNRKRASIGSSSAKVSDKTLAGKVAGVQVESEEADKYAAFKKQKTVEKDSSRFNLEAKSFYNYVKQHIKPEVDEFGIEYEGQVILSFTVNKHGDPRNIKVVKSLNEKCDAQAKRLLESGPSWYFPKGEVRTVVIEF